MMNRKGQGAMEYLMTYGWAILVVIIVGIVLWQSGVFGTGGGGVSGFDKIRIEDYAYSVGAEGFNISFENAVGQSIREVNITYTGDVQTTAYDYCPNDLTPCAADDTWGGATGDTWAPGKEYANLMGSNASACSTVGAGYSVDIRIVYKTEANLYHTEEGTIRGNCEA